MTHIVNAVDDNNNKFEGVKYLNLNLDENGLKVNIFLTRNFVLMKVCSCS